MIQQLTFVKEIDCVRVANIKADEVVLNDREPPFSPSMNQITYF